MALEDLTGTAKFITALNPAWPVDDDWVDEGDNHIRGIKNVLKNTFPGWNGAQGLFPDGTLAAPGIAWANEATAGWYRSASGQFSYAIGGQNKVTLASAAVSVAPPVSLGSGLSVNGLITGAAVATVAQMRDQAAGVLVAANVVRNSPFAAKAWGIISGATGTLVAGAGIGSTNRSAQGSYFVAWSPAFTTAYAVIATANSSQPIICFVDAATYSTAQSFIQTRKHDATGVDPDFVMVAAFGSIN